MNVRNMDFFNLGPQEKYDVIFASQVLEHITAPMRFIEKVEARLNRGGIAHFDVPNQHSLAGLLKRTLHVDHQRYGAVHLPHHLIGYDRKSLGFLLRSHFPKVEVFTANSNHETWGQAGSQTWGMKCFFLVGSIIRRHSLAVGFAQKA